MIASSSMQFARLPDIRDVSPISEEDSVLMEEISATLRRHGALDRFGVTLLHSHFPVADDEILVESCDVVGRTLTIQPVAKAELEGLSYTTTSWHLGSGKPQMACVCVVMGSDHQHHSRG
jgi:hypothetical protein